MEVEDTNTTAATKYVTLHALIYSVKLQHSKHTWAEGGQTPN